MQQVDIVDDAAIHFRGYIAGEMGFVDAVRIVVQPNPEPTRIRHGNGGPVGLLTTQFRIDRGLMETFDDRGSSSMLVE